MTHIEIIILRLLTRKDRYGYELDRIIEENKMRHWAKIGFSSIYNVLNKMEKKSFVASYYIKEQGSPRRKLYRISEEGRSALKKEVTGMLESPAPPHDDFAVALVTSDILSEEEFASALSAYRAHLKQLLEFYAKEIPRHSREKERVGMALERFSRLIEAEMQWLDGL